MHSGPVQDYTTSGSQFSTLSKILMQPIDPSPLTALFDVTQQGVDLSYYGIQCVGLLHATGQMTDMILLR